MSHLRAVPVTERGAEVQSMLDEIRQWLGFEPVFFRVVAWSPDLLRSVWGLVRDVLLSGRLSRSLKERTMISVAHARHCGYCKAVHSVLAIDLGLSLDEIRAASESAAGSEADRAVIDFALRFAEDAKALRDEDYARLRSAGYDDEDIGEIVALSVLSSWAVTLAVGLGLEVDPIIAQRLSEQAT